MNVLPTVLDLLGIEAAGATCVGRSIFAPQRAPRLLLSTERGQWPASGYFATAGCNRSISKALANVSMVTP